MKKIASEIYKDLKDCLVVWVITCVLVGIAVYLSVYKYTPDKVTAVQTGVISGVEFWFMLLISNLLYQFELDIKYSTNNKALRVMLRVLATIVIVA